MFSAFQCSVQLIIFWSLCPAVLNLFVCIKLLGWAPHSWAQVEDIFFDVSKLILKKVKKKSSARA